MRYTAAEQREFDIDDLLAVSLPNEVTDTVLVHVSEPEYDVLRADHRTGWRVVTGPLTHCIVVILSLGQFHVAWCINDDEAAHICDSTHNFAVAARLCRLAQAVTSF